MEIMIYYSLCLLARKKIILNVSYFLGTITFISLSYKTAHKLYEVPIGNHVHLFINNSQNSRILYQYDKRKDFLMNQCGNKTNLSSSKLLEISRYDKALNYLGFIVRSHSLFYCSVPKVATRTLLTYISYLHIRDELIDAFNNNSTLYFNQTSNLFNMDYLNKMLSTSIKNDSVLLLSNLMKAIKSNASDMDIWLMHQNKAFPYIRLHTLADPSILFSTSFTRAIFVRHPLERLASAYIDKIATLKFEPLTHYDSFRRDICRKYASVYLTKAEQHLYVTNRLLKKQINEPCAKIIPSFAHFIEYIMSDGLQVDVHWLPYSSLCNVCTIKYNFIGKYETIEEDLNYIRIKLGFDSSDWKINNHFTTGKTKENYKLLYSNLSNDLLCNLKDFYNQDLKYFNYRLEDYLIEKKQINCSPQSYRRFPIVI